jgi:hypothetical protein
MNVRLGSCRKEYPPAYMIAEGMREPGLAPGKPMSGKAKSSGGRRDRRIERRVPHRMDSRLEKGVSSVTQRRLGRFAPRRLVTDWCPRGS